MIPLEEMRRRVLDSVPVGAARTVAVREARGMVLASDLEAPYDFPLFDNSAMDGFAVRCDDVNGWKDGPVHLRVVGVSAAGHPFDGTVKEGEAIRILTGAPLVSGADSVVPVEVVEFDPSSGIVRIDGPCETGSHVRYRGEVVRKGEVVSRKGDRVNAGLSGFLAALGVNRLEAFERPTIAIVSTGDELLPSGSTPSHGQIFESNSILLEGLLDSMGCSATLLHVNDDLDELTATLDRLGDHFDMIITTGGVSMGAEYDALRMAAATFGVEAFQVAIKPAKPFAFGTLKQALMFGLPGNPASVLVSFESFVRPAIRHFMGVSPAIPPVIVGRTGSRIEHRDDGKAHFIPMSTKGDGTWVPTAELVSHSMRSLAESTAMAVLDPEVLSVREGTEIQLIPLWGPG